MHVTPGDEKDRCRLGNIVWTLRSAPSALKRRTLSLHHIVPPARKASAVAFQLDEAGLRVGFVPLLAPFPCVFIFCVLGGQIGRAHVANYLAALVFVLGRCVRVWRSGGGGHELAGAGFAEDVPAGNGHDCFDGVAEEFFACGTYWCWWARRRGSLFWGFEVDGDERFQREWVLVCWRGGWAEGVQFWWSRG